MPLIKFTHGGKEHTFSGESATNDLANFLAKENFGFTLTEMSQRLIGFIFEYDGIECYFSPTFIVRDLKPAQVKADVQNLIEDFEALTEEFGFDTCPQCNVVYPNTKVEHCKKCGYTPPELQEAKQKLLAQIQGGELEGTDGGQESQETGIGREQDEGELPRAGDPPESSYETGDILPGAGGIADQQMESQQPSAD